MAVFETWLKSDLQKPVAVKLIPGVVFSQDNMANKVGVIVTDGGQPVTLSGTVYGYVIIPTGETVEVEGTIEENKAYFLMPQDCYVPGHISIVIKLTSGETITTLGACTAYVYKSKTDEEVVPSGTPIPDLSVLMEAIDDAMDQVEEVVESIPEDYTNLANDVDDLKSQFDEVEDDISDLQSGKVNKPVASPNGISGQFLKTNGDGTTTWDDPISEPVSEAVADWLDDHPEATTTVEDGSLTESKFTAQTLADLKNDYVTPEMFGAVGDGTTDDTQAIKDMFASGAKKFVFLHELYMVTGGINVTTPGCIIDFGVKTEFTLQKNYDVRDFDYVIGFMASGIITKGYFHIHANFSVNVGIWLSQCAGSTFDHLSCNYARVWGICTDSANASLGSMVFHRLETTACGYKVKATGKVVENGVFEITGMAVGDNLTQAAIRSIFDYSKFRASRYLLNDNAFDYYGTGATTRYGLCSNTGIVLDEEDYTKGTYTVSYGSANTSYNDGENGRAVFIPVGGGIHLCPSRSEGIYNIDFVSTMRCPIGITLDMQYGGTVGRLLSQYDTIVMASNSMSATINYMYVEGVGTGFDYTDKFNRIYLICPNTNTHIDVLSAFVGTNRLAFYEENELPCTQQADGTLVGDTCLDCSPYLAVNKLNAGNLVGSTATEVTIDEYSPRNYTFETLGYDGSTIILDLRDLKAKRRNRFEPVHFYTRKTATVSYYEPFGVTLSQKLIDAGYTINGATDNVYTINSMNYDKMMKVTIILFNKTFYVVPEKIIPGEYALKTDIPVSVLSPTGSTHTLESYPVTYKFGEMATLSVTVTATSQYRFMFKSPDNAATALTIDGITGITGDEVEAGKTYCVDVWAGIATVKELDITPVVVVGTDLVGLFIGRDSNGFGLFELDKGIDSTGAYVTGNSASNPTYIPINPSWRYEKSAWRVYLLTYYDSNYNFISQVDGNTYNQLEVKEITNIPSNAAYIRFCTLNQNHSDNWKIAITRIE